MLQRKYKLPKTNFAEWGTKILQSGLCRTEAYLIFHTCPVLGKTILARLPPSLCKISFHPGQRTKIHNHFNLKTLHFTSKYRIMNSKAINHPQNPPSLVESQELPHSSLLYSFRHQMRRDEQTEKQRHKKPMHTSHWAVESHIMTISIVHEQKDANRSGKIMLFAKSYNC